MIGMVWFCYRIGQITTKDNQRDFGYVQAIKGWRLFRRKAVLKIMHFLYCNFIIVNQSWGSLDPQDGLIYSDYCIYRG